MFEKGEISKGQTISPVRASVNWILWGKKVSLQWLQKLSRLL